MFKKLWIFLTENDYHAQSHRKGMIVLLFLISIILSAPLVWSKFLPDYSFEQNEDEVAQLREEYQLFLDSIDVAKKERVHKENYNWNKKQYSYKPSSYKKTKPKKKQIILFNLNEATENDLVQVKGIGNYYAQRIIKFRDKLGGFYKKEQLYEVYGLDSVVVKRAFKYLKPSPLVVKKKLNINSDEFKVILGHPYLEYKDVQAVFNNRPLTDKKLCEILPVKCEKLQAYLIY